MSHGHWITTELAREWGYARADQMRLPQREPGLVLVTCTERHTQPTESEGPMSEPSVDEILGMIDQLVPDPPICPNCRHRQSMHDEVKVNPASPTCSCVHPFHAATPTGSEGADTT